AVRYLRGELDFIAPAIEPVGDRIEGNGDALVALVFRHLVVEIARKQDEITGFGNRQHVFAGIERAHRGLAGVVPEAEFETAGRANEYRPRTGMRRREIEDTGDKAVRVAMHRLTAARLEQVGPHLLHRPVEAFAEHHVTKVDQFGRRGRRDFLEEIAVQRIGDRGVEKLVGPQIGLDLVGTDRRNGRISQLRTQYMRRSHQWNWE